MGAAGPAGPPHMYGGRSVRLSSLVSGGIDRRRFIGHQTAASELCLSADVVYIVDGYILVVYLLNGASEPASRVHPSITAIRVMTV